MLVPRVGYRFSSFFSFSPFSFSAWRLMLVPHIEDEHRQFSYELQNGGLGALPCKCMYIYTYACMYLHTDSLVINPKMGVAAHAYTHTFLCMYAWCMHACMHLNIYTLVLNSKMGASGHFFYVCMYTYVCMYVCICTHVSLIYPDQVLLAFNFFGAIGNICFYLHTFSLAYLSLVGAIGVIFCYN